VTYLLEIAWSQSSKTTESYTRVLQKSINKSDQHLTTFETYNQINLSSKKVRLSAHFLDEYPYFLGG
jgi:hypothetical protein